MAFWELGLGWAWDGKRYLGYGAEGMGSFLLFCCLFGIYADLAFVSLWLLLSLGC